MTISYSFLKATEQFYLRILPVKKIDLQAQFLIVKIK